MTTISASFYHKNLENIFGTKVNEGEVAIVFPERAVQKDWKMRIRSFPQASCEINSRIIYDMNVVLNSHFDILFCSRFRQQFIAMSWFIRFENLTSNRIKDRTNKILKSSLATLPIRPLNPLCYIRFSKHEYHKLSWRYKKIKRNEILPYHLFLVLTRVFALMANKQKE